MTSELVRLCDPMSYYDNFLTEGVYPDGRPIDEYTTVSYKKGVGSGVGSALIRQGGVTVSCTVFASIVLLNDGDLILPEIQSCAEITEQTRDEIMDTLHNLISKDMFFPRSALLCKGIDDSLTKITKMISNVSDSNILGNDVESVENERLRGQSERQRRRRARETSVERTIRLRSDSLRHRAERSSESPETQSRRQTANRSRDAARRSNESNDQRRTRLDREIQRRRRIQTGLAGREIIPNELYIGRMNILCQDCGALHFAGEPNRDNSYNMCCNFGSFQIDKFQSYPQFLKNLLIGQSNEDKEFRRLIRSYNNAVAMASMGAQLDFPRGRGPYCFRIHDQVYHFIGPLHPDREDSPKFGQIYILDTDTALQERMHNPANTECNPNIMNHLGTFIQQHNIYAESFRMMQNVLETEKTNAAREGRSAEPVRMIFDINEHLDRRRFNLPITNEVAVVFVGQDEDVPPNRSYAVHEIGGGLRTIRDIDPEVDPLVYPVLFPTGEPGWHTELRKPDGKRITQLEYYRSMIQDRQVFNPLHYSGKLFQQFIVDCFVKIEQNRLNYERTHQKELRADTYISIRDFVTGEQIDGPPGKRIILTSSFKSGPRGMRQSYQDAMSIVAKYGKPDYFLTITCNPNWREIKEQLKEGQNASDRPDIVARVFELKLNALFDDLFKKNVLGEVAAYISVIEFQKRGLPHCHMLIIMKENSKPRRAEDVDRFISAEIPDRFLNPTLYESVKLMVHRPCGAYNPKSPCMEKNQCTKHYPMELRETTVLEGTSYPKYRRRDQGREMEVSGYTVDNKWIVPHNPYLLAKYNAHMNLEVCNLITAVMYLYKYVYKGTDQAALKIFRKTATGETEQVFDEISAYLKTRYVCAPEACHRIFGFDMEKKSDTVYRLDIHLPDHQTVTFEPGQEQQVLEQDRATSLLAWFKINTESTQKFGPNVTANAQDSRQFFYLEMPEHFTYDGKKWKPRVQQRKTIGRIYAVSPRDQERFSLRTLLLYRKGCKSFADLKTVNGAVLETFTEAAKALDLLSDDSYYMRCMEESCLFQTPKELRSLFACLIVFTEMSNTEEIWDNFQNEMCFDFEHQNFTHEQSICLAYYDILDKVAIQGINLTERIPPPLMERPAVITQQIDYDECTRVGARDYKKLNPAQKLFVDTILHGVEQGQQKLIFLDGPGGSGKTFAYTVLWNILTGRHKKVLNVAWTGIAANLLPFGRTASSAFKLPITEGPRTSSMFRESKEARVLKDIEVIIWDEAPMSPKYALEAADLLLKDIMQNNHPFGGKQVILGGDFRQILPVVEHGGEEETVSTCIKMSNLWSKFRTMSLTHNMRLEDGNSSWANYLLQIGADLIPRDEEDCVPVPEEILLPEGQSLIDWVFGDDLLQQNISEIVNRAILTPRNEEALELNLQILAKLPGEEKVYTSVDDAITDENQENAYLYTPEFLHSMTPSGFPPHELHLKQGAIVMLLRNIDVKAGLCNGTRLIVKQMGTRILGCEIATGSKKGNFVLIPKIDNYYDKILNANGGVTDAVIGAVSTALSDVRLPLVKLNHARDDEAPIQKEEISILHQGFRVLCNPPTDCLKHCNSTCTVIAGKRGVLFLKTKGSGCDLRSVQQMIVYSEKRVIDVLSQML